MEENKPSLDGVDIIKPLYKTKNSIIYLIRNKSTKDNVSVLKGINKTNVTTKEVEMIKRERAFYEYNSKKNNILFPKFYHPFKDNVNIYMEISFIQGLNLSHLIMNDHLLKFNYNDSNINLFLCLISQIISMIDQLHSEGYIYRDLKMNNIIIDKKLKCYLVDFGFVKHFDSDRAMTNTVCGTLHMKAPELFLLSQKRQNEYDGFKVDIYSIGVLMYEMYMGQPPFPYTTSNEDEYSQMILKGLNNETHFNQTFYGDIKNKEDCELIKDLIINCMKTNPEERITMKEMKEHKLFKGQFEKYKNMNEELMMSGEKQCKAIADYINFNGEFEEDYLISEEKKKMDDLFNQFF